MYIYVFKLYGTRALLDYRPGLIPGNSYGSVPVSLAGLKFKIPGIVPIHGTTEVRFPFLVSFAGPMENKPICYSVQLGVHL